MYFYISTFIMQVSIVAFLELGGGIIIFSCSFLLFLSCFHDLNMATLIFIDQENGEAGATSKDRLRLPSTCECALLPLKIEHFKINQECAWLAISGMGGVGILSNISKHVDSCWNLFSLFF